MAAPSLTVQLPAGLAVSQPSLVTLTGIVDGLAGTQVTVDAVVAGPTIELEYANNESSARDTIPAEDPTDPTDPTDPADPTDPTDPADDTNDRDDAGRTGSTDEGRGDVGTNGTSDRVLAATGAQVVTLLTAAVALLGAGLGFHAAAGGAQRRRRRRRP